MVWFPSFRSYLSYLSYLSIPIILITPITLITPTISCLLCIPQSYGLVEDGVLGSGVGIHVVVSYALELQV